MGGYGSGGRNYRGRIVAESTMHLDIRDLRQRGMLALGQRGSIDWSWSNGSKASVGFAVGSDEIALLYMWTDPQSGEVRSVTDRIGVQRRPCRLGGARPFFVCVCDRAVEVLYFRGGRFRCRLCARVAYASQYERPADRARRRAGKIQRRFGCGSSLDEGMPLRPKGMWRRTYESLIARLVAAEEAEAVIPIMQRLLARYA
jgi:hypothetical protein